MMNHARDMLSIFQLMAEGDQGDKRTSYISYIQKLIGDTENDLHTDTIALLDSDRCPWEKIW